jgi:hypothetical protein
VLADGVASTGGAGLALPAGICNFNFFVIFFAMLIFKE